MEAESLAKAEALAADLGLGFHQMAKALAATEVSAKLACSQTCLVQAAEVASEASFEGASGASFVEAMAIEVVSAEVVTVVSVGYLKEASNSAVVKEKVMDLQKEAWASFVAMVSLLEVALAAILEEASCTWVALELAVEMPEAALASSETMVSKAWDSEGEERATMASTGKVS